MAGTLPGREAGGHCGSRCCWGGCGRGLPISWPADSAPPRCAVLQEEARQMVAAADADGDGKASWLAGGASWAGPGWRCLLLTD